MKQIRIAAWFEIVGGVVLLTSAFKKVKSFMFEPLVVGVAYDFTFDQVDDLFGNVGGMVRQTL